MTKSWFRPLLACAVAVGVSACTQVRTSGRVATAMTTVGMEANEMVVRPTEVQWSMGDPVVYTSTVLSTELLPDATGPVGVFFGGPDARTMPPHVRLAATRAVAEKGADGILLTHYLVQATQEPGDIRYDVQVFGRLLELSELSIVDGARADRLEGLQEQLDRLRGVPAEHTHEGSVQTRRPSPPPPAPAPVRPSPRPPPPPPTLTTPPPAPPEAEAPPPGPDEGDG